MDKVFISYSHKDRAWVKDWLLPRLELHEIQTHIDYRDFEIGVPALVNMERAVEECAKTLMVLTPNYVNSEFSQFEAIMLQTQDPIGLRKKMLPLMQTKCDLPKRLAMITYADFLDKNNHETELIRVVNQIKKDFGLLPPPKPDYPTLAEENIYIERLPETGFTLFGRQKELKILDDAWQASTTNVISFVAFGGVGKSTLVKKWAERLRWENYRGAQKVFAWSFYSQGTNERVTSAEQFINYALKWFGDADPAAGSAWDKGQRLANLVRRQKTLLLLDGLEPLQSAHEFEKGKIKDPALSMLVQELARDNNGLCVITTRQPVFEMANHPECCTQHDLEKLSPQAGAALLRLQKVSGSDAQLEAAVQNFGNHALAINLLGAWLHDLPGHDISSAQDIANLPEVTEADGKHPRRVMAAFAQRFGASAECDLLNVLGLFDRPVDLAAIAAVTKAPVITNLTEFLSGQSDAAFRSTCDSLRRAKLLAPESSHNPGTLDCHPLVREHFAAQVQQAHPHAWREAHSRLYDYYKNLPEKELPDTLVEMEPLFAAVAHGCLAGKHQEAIEDVYFKRISRENDSFIVKKLGAFGSDLAALSNFFDPPWRQPAAGLTDADKAIVLSWAGFGLRSLGRLREAAEPMQAGMENLIQQKNWKQAAVAAGNLSELFLTIGEVQQAVAAAHQSVDFADRSGDGFQREVARTQAGDALHQSGVLDEAEKFFREAEAMQQQSQRSYRYLYSLQGFQFCDLLLSQGQVEEVLLRAELILNVGVKDRVLLEIGLGNLSIGRAYLQMILRQAQGPEISTEAEPAEAGLSFTDHPTSTLRYFGKTQHKQAQGSYIAKATTHLNQAIAGLREFSAQEFIPKGLFARAALHRMQGHFPAAWQDLHEAQEIAQRGEKGLHLADFHLEACRLCLAEGRKTEAQEHLSTAEKMVHKMGYLRRVPEIEVLLKMLV